MISNNELIKYKVKEFYHTPSNENDSKNINPVCSCAYKIYNRVTDKLEFIAVIENKTHFIDDEDSRKLIKKYVTSINDDCSNIGEEMDRMDRIIEFEVSIVHEKDFRLSGTSQISAVISGDFSINLIDLCNESWGNSDDGTFVLFPLKKDHNFLVEFFNDRCVQKKKDYFLPQIYELLVQNGHFLQEMQS